MATQTSCVCGSTPIAEIMRCSDGSVPVFRARDRLASRLRGGLKFQGLERYLHGEITHAVELAHGRFGQVVEREIGIAHFIGSEMSEIHLVIDVGAIGNFFAVAVFADHSSPEVVHGYQMISIRTGNGHFSPGRNTTDTGAETGIVAAREPFGA